MKDTAKTSQKKGGAQPISAFFFVPPPSVGGIGSRQQPSFRWRRSPAAPRRRSAKPSVRSSLKPTNARNPRRRIKMPCSSHHTALPWERTPSHLGVGSIAHSLYTGVPHIPVDHRQLTSRSRRPANLSFPPTTAALKRLMHTHHSPGLHAHRPPEHTHTHTRT